MPLASGSDLMLLHGLQQGGLRLGWGPIDFVRENDIGKHWAGHEPQLSAGIGFAEHLGAGDVRWHEVWRELDARKLKVKNLGNRFHQQRLGQAGRASDQDMATGEQGNEDLVDHVFLADDGFAQLGLDAAGASEDLVHGFSVGGGLGFGIH